MTKQIFFSSGIRLTKLKLDGRNVAAESLIKQLSQYRKASKLKYSDIKKSCPSIGSNGHIAGIERMKQKENTIQVIEYCRALGLKEITIQL